MSNIFVINHMLLSWLHKFMLCFTFQCRYLLLELQVRLPLNLQCSFKLYHAPDVSICSSESKVNRVCSKYHAQVREANGIIPLLLEYSILLIWLSAFHSPQHTVKTLTPEILNHIQTSQEGKQVRHCQHTLIFKRDSIYTYHCSSKIYGLPSH